MGGGVRGGWGDRGRTSKRRERYLQRHVDGTAYIDIVDPALIDAVRSLPERQRDVVVFRVLLGLSADQVAIDLGIEPGTVGTHLRRGLSALRSSITHRTDPCDLKETLS